MKDEKKQFTCLVCGKGTSWDDNPFRPFCSERCKLIDLGNWAEEAYRIPDGKIVHPGGEAREKKHTEK